ncbi:MAG: class F sortase [Actinomycetota bacterium]|jgi:sortase (surface protein transpeptidase)|nr:class F sortase [Actinomycetota bacterium]
MPFTHVPQPVEAPGRDLRPARIRIPALDVDRRPVPLGVLDDGSLEAPRRYPDIGWWKDGPLPGAKGNAVVVGHVDSETGPAVFYGLSSLAPGDQISVTRRDAFAVRFRVRSVQRFPLEDFPAKRVYRRDGPSGLVLITCGGTYDRAAGRYLDNVVVFADRAR